MNEKIEHFDNMANIWWIVFCCTIPGIYSDKVILEPSGVAFVEEYDNVDFTCKLDLNKTLSNWNVIIKLSIPPGNLISIGSIDSTCHSESDTPIIYRINCDMKKSIMNIQLRSVTREQHNINVSCIFKDNINSDRDEKTTRVFVKVPVKDINTNVGGSLVVESNVIQQLECQSSYSRPQPNVTWLLVSPGQRYQRMSLQASKGDKIQKENELVKVTKYVNYIPKVADDKGVLFCEASNDNRTIVRSPNVTINLKYQPNIIKVKVIGRKEDSKGSLYNVSCTANGNPLPNISWRSGNTQMMLQQDNKVLTSVLQNKYIPCDSESHIYTCVAANNIGKSAMKDIKVPSRSCKETSYVPALTQTDVISTSVAAFMLTVAIIAIVIYLKCRKKPQNEEDVVNTEMPSRPSPPPIPAPRNNTEEPGRSNDYENAEIDDENVLYAHTRFQRRPPLNVKARSYNSLVLVHSIPRSREKLNATKLAALGGYSSESALDSICQGHSEPLRVVSKPEHNIETPPMVAPRSRNYLHLDLPTESGNVIHGIGNRTKYSDVWFHASN